MDFWHHVLSVLEKRVSRQCFDTWFKPIVFLGCENEVLKLKVPTENFKKCLIENFAQVILQAASAVSKSQFTLNICAETASSAPAQPVSPPDTAPADHQPVLIARYTFDAFVVGASNQLAHAAALAVAERPSKAYNPLYLYGGVGLGKTHLMHAIGNFIRTKSPATRLVYISSETFMNELVNAIRYDRTLQFRQKYRNIEVLLMDDIQFLAGKERTQEEFFHTFNALYDAQKQIVIASDCPPRQIPTLEESLHSRFEWGLIADIQPPDLETKLAILRKKAERESITLQDDVALYIASGVRSNIRELEGALNRLSARAFLDRRDPQHIDLAYAKEVLQDLTCDETSNISVDKVMQAVASFFRLKPAQLKTKSNARPIAVPRQIAMYLCKELTNKSLPQIGKDFGGKHHTTVLHSIRKIESLCKKDSEISTAVNEILKSLR